MSEYLDKLELDLNGDGVNEVYELHDTEARTLIDNKVSKVDGKGLSTNDYTTEDKNKLSGIASGAEVNVQSDWNVTDTTSDAYIKNKPQIPSAVTESTVSGWGFTKNTGTYSKPSGGIPASDLASGVIPTSLPASDVKAWAKADNKPSYTASEVGALANTVTHLSGDIATSEKGSANGVATLDANGLVPSSQLPSYVDDVLEYTNKASFPTIGETGKIYVDKTTNLTWRWSGTTYVEISPSLALGETSSTAYAGNKGKANADAISALQTTVGALPTSFAPTNAQANVIETVKVNNVALTPSNKAVNVTVPTQPSDIGAMASTVTHLSGDVPTTRKVNNKALSADITLTASDVGARASDWTPTKSDVGLGNVGNFKAVSTVANQGLTDTEKSNARANIGAGTSSFSGSYNDLSNKPTIPSAVTESTVSGWGFTKNTGTYSKPSGGIPKTDLASAVQTSLDKADAALPNTSDGVSAGINKLSTGVATPTDNDYYISQYVNGGTTTTSYHRRPHSSLWNYIKGKIDAAKYATQSWVEGKGYLTGITKSQVTTALGYTPPQSDTNTTYTFAEGSTNGAFSVTPSGGSATSVKIHGLGSLAYSSATIPTNTNQLTNGAGFITSSGSCASATKATQDASGNTITSTYATKTELNGKQNALATQTAYNSKGTATKVPQITTNTLGQVTSITEVDITATVPNYWGFIGGGTDFNTLLTVGIYVTALTTPKDVVHVPIDHNGNGILEIYPTATKTIQKYKAYNEFGVFLGQFKRSYNTITKTWDNWQKMYRDGVVLWESPDQGFSNVAAGTLNLSSPFTNYGSVKIFCRYGTANPYIVSTEAVLWEYSGHTIVKVDMITNSNNNLSRRYRNFEFITSAPNTVKITTGYVRNQGSAEASNASYMTPLLIVGYGD